MRILIYDNKGDSVQASSAEDGTGRMCAGKILYMNGEYDLGFDTDELIEKCGQRTNRIVGRI